MQARIILYHLIIKLLLSRINMIEILNQIMVQKLISHQKNDIIFALPT